jgi:molybdopterin converting factor small subunit
MSIKIIIPSYLQPFTNDTEVVEAEGNTVRECLDYLTRIYPDIKKMLYDKRGKPLNYVGTYVNGEDSYPDGLAKAVKDGDEVHIQYMIAGG